MIAVNILQGERAFVKETSTGNQASNLYNNVNIFLIDGLMHLLLLESLM